FPSVAAGIRSVFGDMERITTGLGILSKGRPVAEVDEAARGLSSAWRVDGYYAGRTHATHRYRRLLCDRQRSRWAPVFGSRSCVDRASNWPCLDGAGYDARRNRWRDAILEAIDVVFPDFAAKVLRLLSLPRARSALISMRQPSTGSHRRLR